MTKKNLMSVTVKLFADLTKYGPNKSENLLSEGSSINSILKKYNIPTEKMKLIILVNGRPRYDREFVLKNGDTIAFFPPLGGG